MGFVGPVGFIEDGRHRGTCGRVTQRREVRRDLRVRRKNSGKSDGNDQESRRPRLGSLQGKFLSMESQLEDEVVETDTNEEYFDSFGDVREGLPRTGLEPTVVKKWNRRAEAAKKRWANPEYRKKMMEKRRRKKEGEEKTERKHRVQIGNMDSVTLSSDEKAREINAYAQSNKLRSEKLEKLHQDKEKWMQERLASGSPLRDHLNNDEYKRQRQLERKRLALERVQKMKEEAARRKEARKSQNGPKPNSSKQH